MISCSVIFYSSFRQEHAIAFPYSRIRKQHDGWMNVHSKIPSVKLTQRSENYINCLL